MSVTVETHQGGQDDCNFALGCKRRCKSDAGPLGKRLAAFRGALSCCGGPAVNRNWRELDWRPERRIEVTATSFRRTFGHMGGRLNGRLNSLVRAMARSGQRAFLGDTAVHPRLGGTRPRLGGTRRGATARLAFDQDARATTREALLRRSRCIRPGP
jgi:hypothetical protein